MNTYAEFIEAMTIFLKYPHREAGLSADSYGIFAGPHPNIVSPEDILKLQELGWEVQDSYGCFYYFI